MKATVDVAAARVAAAKEDASARRVVLLHALLLEQRATADAHTTVLATAVSCASFGRHHSG